MHGAPCVQTGRSEGCWRASSRGSSRALTWADTRADLYHYRTRDGVEVDLVIEARDGRVIAIDVKASSTARAEDFRGIRHLRDRLGSDFVAGLRALHGPGDSHLR